jgi:hypothetical protein
MERHIVYYKGEGAGLPQVQATVSLVSPASPSLLVALSSIKSAPTMHYQFVVRFCAGSCE